MTKITTARVVRQGSVFKRFVDITAATPDQLAEEYVSLTREYVKRGHGEFTNVDVMMRYKDLVFALGMFVYEEAFPAAVDKLGFTVLENGIVFSKSGQY